MAAINTHSTQTALEDNIYGERHNWLAGRQGDKFPFLPVLKVTGNFKAIIARYETASNFVERVNIKYREDPVGGFDKPFAAAERQTKRCVMLSEEMATAYNNFASCLVYAESSSFPDELYGKRTWSKDAAQVSRLMRVVYYNVLTATASLEKILELIGPGLRLKNELLA
ncbi:hypothetical protein QBC36DRAFT_294917 [Triangularia setosa]|uniref:Uncharacterized protein n=1 Tax=Triangularia setosa TaxID=2587417 RepID=A0AAN6W016_9PEZI|nr:hypothetical protein QBC36DRAFT_294917 [Podospora setosa]